MIKEFDCVIDYHPDRANVVVDALICKNKAVVETSKGWDERELIELKKVDTKIDVGPEGSLIPQLKVQFILWDKVLEVQQRDVEVGKVRNRVKLAFEIPF